MVHTRGDAIAFLGTAVNKNVIVHTRVLVMYKTPYLCDTTCHTINPQSLHNNGAVDINRWVRNFYKK